MPTCGTCGTPLDPTHRFCRECGSPRPTDAGGPTPFLAPDEADPRVVDVAVDDEPTSDGSAAPTEVITLTGGVDLAACPGCDAINAVERPRCARCGTPLQDDVEPLDDDPWDVRHLPVDDEASGNLAVPPGGDGRGPWGLGIAVVVGGALVGAVLAAWMFGFGPFERADGTDVEFRGSDYPGQAEAVRPDQARTSSVREPVDGRAFDVTQAVDGDVTTAWVGADGNGANVTFTFDRPMWVTAVEVANGDQHDEESFEATARVRTLETDLGHGSRLRATLLSGTGWQVFRPLAPVLTDRITLVVLDRTEGDEVALSEVRFMGFPANDADARSYAEAT